MERQSGSCLNKNKGVLFVEYKNINELNQPIIQKLILSSINVDQHKPYVHRKRVATVYVGDPERPGPFGNKKGGLFNEFVWRHTNSAPAPTKVVKEFITPLLEKEGISGPLIVRWNRYAGCNMCPCSPGYSITTRRPYLQFPYHIWLGWE